MDLLPSDVLAKVVALLPPRTLAASLCVCKEWRAIVDASCLLRADLLPLSVAGIFVSITEEYNPLFLRRPSRGPTQQITNNLDYVVGVDDRYSMPRVKDCCNGLLLLDHCVVINPATRQWTRLPPCPSSSPNGMDETFYYKTDYMFLMFEPTMSPHYSVLAMPYLMGKPEDEFVEGLEWPSSPCIIQVFSSSVQQWEEGRFVREGEADCTAADLLKSRPNWDEYYYDGVYWREAMYVHCTNNILMRIALLDGKYQMIKTPAGVDARYYMQLRLGKSKCGVYCASVLELQLRVWFLHESGGGKIEWICMHDTNLNALAAHYVNTSYINGPWIWTIKGNPKKLEMEWDSDDDNVLDIDKVHSALFDKDKTLILGFHPYKEVIFLHVNSEHAVAYHWNSSKVQYMGDTYILYDYSHAPEVESSFIYMPCLDGRLM